MESKKAKWLTNPTKKQVILVSLLWVTGLLLVLLATSDFFTENPFILQNLILFVIASLSVITLITMFVNYSKNKRDGTSE
jgi:uncharacterized membrane protein